MQPWLIALFFGVGVAGFVYTKLVRGNGNANPGQNFAGAAVVGALAFFVLFTFLKYVLNF